MTGRVFREYDPVTGVTKSYHYGWKEGDPDGFLLHEKQDVAPVIEEAKARADLEPAHSVLLGHSRRRLIALIPDVLWEQLYRERRTLSQDPEGFRAWLNSHENKPFRVWPGRV